jgi:glyoxylase-like metal-dependent hydrolase (beta-lactamase superfamily II)
MTFRLLALLAALLSTTVNAADNPILKIEPLADNIYALIGPTTNRTPENLGNNANFGVIVTTEGVVLIDSGGSYRGAEMIHHTIQRITDQPIKVVINSGGQDHRWLGNSYFKALGATILSSEQAQLDQQSRLQDQLIMLDRLVGAEGLEGTEAIYADDCFTEKRVLTLGDTRIELHHAGHAHTPGDSFVWLPEQQVLFSGDIVYMDRMLGIGPQSAHHSWIKAFEAIAALQPKIIVGGHGNPGDLAKATADSYDYLVFLREMVLQFIEEGYGIEEVGKIDQSPFSHLQNFDALKGRNAQRVYEELEWE